MEGERERIRGTITVKRLKALALFVVFRVSLQVVSFRIRPCKADIKYLCMISDIHVPLSDHDHAPMLRSVCLNAQTTLSTTSFWCSGGISNRVPKQCVLTAFKNRKNFNRCSGKSCNNETTKQQNKEHNERVVEKRQGM